MRALAQAAVALARLLPAERREQLLADLDEEFLERSASEGYHAADRWYARQLLRSAGPLTARWIEQRLLATLPSEPPSIGQAFFGFAVTWLVLVGTLIPFETETPSPVAAPSSEWRPSAVILEDGVVHFVYSLSDRPEEQPTPPPGPSIRPLILAFAPPAVLFAGLLFALPIGDAFRRRRGHAAKA